jgi:hypothetical protein
LAKKPFNPFYFLLLVFGTLFALTACAYGVMAVKLQRPDEARLGSTSGAAFLGLLDQYGTVVFIVELAALALVTVGAIATDEYWSRRQRAAAGQAAAPPDERRT